MNRKKQQQKSQAAEKEKQLNFEEQTIVDRLKEVKFKKVLIGGVDESEVWEKIEQLNEYYKLALKAERTRHSEELEALRLKGTGI
ncbi:MAG: hypothetical protein HUJ54_05335 [Erysipelotrichaceae bacterium]|nr:hypothetical protein [Erysipelotrichaceae bacterium]